MASKGPRSKLDHETRVRRQKALEAPKEPRRRKTHWDHVLEEMAWLSKDFESERKWKLAQAKKVAFKASKGKVDQATRGEKRVKEEEQKLRKVALNISKDVKKFWLKIEKLVLYKHQMVLEMKKKKALDKQLEYLLGQTERYSTMLAENLVEKDNPLQLHLQFKEGDRIDDSEHNELNCETQADDPEIDDDYDLLSEDDLEDDEHTLEEDEALITEKERQEELAALRDEVDLPLEVLLERYKEKNVSRESSAEMIEDVLVEPTLIDSEKIQVKGDQSVACNVDTRDSHASTIQESGVCNGSVSTSDNHLVEVEKCEAKNSSKVYEVLDGDMVYDFGDEQEDGDFVVTTGEAKDDEATLSEEEELAKEESKDSVDEISLLQKDSELPLEELLARYKKDFDGDEISEDESENAFLCSDLSESPLEQDIFELQEQTASRNKEKNGEIESIVDSIAEENQGKPSMKFEEKGNLVKTEENESEARIADAAAAARSAQPTGNTFSTTKVRTKFPFLIKHPLREYQHIGLDWLVTMYEKKLNGILADEMGLGKTIMTIALLAHLACEKGIWGPHLIVVPTSVMLNWETEFLRWCPAFKILTYFGSAKERKIKRQGWLKPNFFHVCITTYRLVIQDSKIFKRKKWKYLILDEAHLIKNWKSQRWQTLLNFNSKRRILLTGTPLQNDLMELWSLMHFLMPHVFQSHQEFKDWFSNPISGMVDGQEKVNKEVIDRLHNVLRPFILRRLKKDVEKQLPVKVEHVIYCRLSRRQRNLYEDFIASSETQATLSSSNFFGMISVIMQLRKVCNHPDLFEGRPIISSFDMVGMNIQLSSNVCSILSPDPSSIVNLVDLGFLFTHLDFSMNSWEANEVVTIATPSSLIKDRTTLYDDMVEIGPRRKVRETNIFEEIQKSISNQRLREAKERAESIAWWNALKCRKKPLYSTTLRELVTIKQTVCEVNGEIILSPVGRFHKMINLVESFMFAIPAARAPSPKCWCSKSGSSVFLHPSYTEKCSKILLPLLSPIRPAIIRTQVYFPDRRLIQFDCGKLQQLAVLLRRLKSEGHRALIFTQMTKVLDILEVFINLYGYTYMRLDGSTQPEERQTLMQRFNTNPKIFLFILSTRSGGVGINLVGADTVIFYDSDWNPAMDQQAQDRCHRIGQTREVHIYRLISESTIEENILKKANQKRALDDLVIQSGGYNTEFFKKLDPMELISGHTLQKDKNKSEGNNVSLSTDDLDAALKYAEDEADYMALKKLEQEEAVENQEFTEEANIGGRLEDDEFVNEDDMKDQPANEEKSLTIAAEKEDDADTLADVTQMAAAAAASGQAISSFENQLRPIDRYAIRFMELCDPVVDKTALEYQNRFEETEWELDRIEKLKEDMEAEIDEDDEPLVYESWDADFATEAYRAQVEALTQHQLMEDLELEAKQKEDAEREIFESAERNKLAIRKPKSKKKAKKTKFKSLKKGALASDSRSVKEEPFPEYMSTDDDDDEFQFLQKKRKKPDPMHGFEDEFFKKKKSKNNKRIVVPTTSPLDENSVREESKQIKSCDDTVMETEPKLSFKTKNGGKISITAMTIKRGFMIKPSKLNKKCNNIWSSDYLPSPDSWSPQEDAVLCAIVHEYGPNWSLVNDYLYGMSAGGFYRGRYRFPVHCCERYRELIQHHVLSSTDGLKLNNEKVTNASFGKAHIKVTEENMRTLLDMAIEMPDRELLIQRHFTSLLSSVWRVSSSRTNSSSSSVNNTGRLFGVNISQVSRNFHKKPKKINMTNLNQSKKLLAAVLNDISMTRPDDQVAVSDRRDEAAALSISERLELTLQFSGPEVDVLNPLPPIINVSIYGSDSPNSANKHTVEDPNLRRASNLAENRFRAATSACIEGNLDWASSAFPTGDLKSSRSSSKSLSLGKHKLPFSDSTKSSKSKLRKITIEHGETLNQDHETIFHSIPPPLLTPDDPNLGLHPTPNFNHDLLYFPEEENESLLNLGSSELVCHQYVPGLISGLDDDYSTLMLEYTDLE